MSDVTVTVRMPKQLRDRLEALSGGEFLISSCYLAA